MRTVNQCGRCGARDKTAHKTGCEGRKVKTLVYGRADFNAAREAGCDKRPDNIRVFDNGGPDEGGTADRYTVVRTTPIGFRDHETARRHDWRGHYAYIAASAAPFHPQGIGMSGETEGQPLYNAGKWGARVDPNRSDKPARWRDLPADVRQCAWQLAFDDNEA